MKPEQDNDTEVEQILTESVNQDEDGMMERMTAQADQNQTPMGADYG